MTRRLPTKVYLVDRVPPPTEQRGRFTAPYGALRRLYTSLGHVKQFVDSHSGRWGGQKSEFKVYQAEVVWREIEPDSLYDSQPAYNDPADDNIVDVIEFDK